MLNKLYFFILLLSFLIILSCTKNQDDDLTDIELFFPSCFSGELHDMRGSTMFIEVDVQNQLMKLLIDHYSIPSGAELRTQCNLIEYFYPTDPVSSEIVNLYREYDNLSNEPANPCHDLYAGAKPPKAILGHDWISGYNGALQDSIYFEFEYVILYYDISEMATVWKGETYGWDGIVKGKLIDVVSSIEVNNTTYGYYFLKDEAFFETFNSSGYAPYSSTAEDLAFITHVANFPRVLNYLSTLSLYLNFARPGKITNTPQSLEGDFSLEMAIAYDSYMYKNSGTNIQDRFQATIAKNDYSTYDSIAAGACGTSNNNAYCIDPIYQMTNYQGKTGGLARCEVNGDTETKSKTSEKSRRQEYTTERTYPQFCAKDPNKTGCEWFCKAYPTNTKCQ